MFVHEQQLKFLIVRALEQGMYPYIMCNIPFSRIFDRLRVNRCADNCAVNGCRYHGVGGV